MPYNRNPEFDRFQKHLKEISGQPLRIRKIFKLDKSGKPISKFEFHLERKSNDLFQLQEQAHTHSRNISDVVSELNSKNFFSYEIFPHPHFVKCGASRRIDEINDILFDFRTSDDSKKNEMINEASEIVRHLTPDDLHFDIYREVKEDKEINEELIYLVFRIISNRGQIIGKEEPEIHIHPELQKSVFTFLEEEAKLHKTTFLITTHSNIFLNENRNGSTYLIRLISDKTSVCEKIERETISDALSEIGLTYVR